MRLVLLHARFGTLELLRLPAYLVPTLGFPTLFFAIFVAPHVDRTEAPLAMALFAGFAVLGVAFFQFGVGIATERQSPWERYLRTLPLAPGTRFAGRILSALAFGSASAVVLIGTALAITSVALDSGRWLQLAAALLLGAIPFALLGIALGYLTSPRAALPIANVLYLGLSYAGGLWTTPEELPRRIAAISTYLPTRALADALLAAVTPQPTSVRPWLILLGYTAFFAAAALWGYRRDEGQRYS